MINLITQFDEIVKNNNQYQTIDLVQKGKVIAKTLVDTKYYNQIIENCNIFFARGYAQIQIKDTRENKSLHLYIYYDLEKNVYDKAKSNTDHINRNKLNNTVCNLRACSIANNSKNKSKRKNSTSTYYGVSYQPKRNIWKCVVVYNRKHIGVCYDIEEHAAYHYDILMKELLLDDEFTPLNNIPCPDNFVRKAPFERKQKLPKGVTQVGKKFRSFYRGIPLGTFSTIDEAEQRYLQAILDYKQHKIDKRLSAPIKRNKYGLAVIELFNKNKEKIGETIIDEDLYYELILGNWYYDQGYVTGKINDKKWALHRYIKREELKEYDTTYCIDHINRDRLDNRRENLKIVTQKENSQNKTCKKKSLQKYVGIRWSDSINKYESSITVDGEYINIGYFHFEKDAVKSRNEYIRTKLDESYNYPIQEYIETDDPHPLELKTKITSDFVGVDWDNFTKKWRSRLGIDGDRKVLGFFDNQQEAVNARNNYIIDNNLDRKKYPIQDFSMSGKKNIPAKKEILTLESSYVGVSWHKRNGKWQSNISVKKKTNYLGIFATEKEALNARNTYIIENKLNQKIYKIQTYIGETHQQK